MATTSRLMPSRSDPSPSINIHDALRISGSGSGSGSSSSSVHASADAGVVVSKTAQEMWKDITSSSDHKKIVGGGGGGGEGSCAHHHHTMTLEDYLAKEGIVREDDGRTVTLDHQHQLNQQQMGMESGPMMGLVMESVYAQQPPPPAHPLLGYGSGVEGVGGRAGKRRAAPEDPVVDKVAQQKQRRMIKNRESAARSRERKQAYTMELEAMVATLEEEQAGLLREQVVLLTWVFDGPSRLLSAIKGFREEGDVTDESQAITRETMEISDPVPPEGVYVCGEDDVPNYALDLEERQKKRLEELMGTEVPVIERRGPLLRRTLSF